MEFVVTGRDGTDDGAAKRRQINRPAHLARAAQHMARGEQLLGAALLEGDLMVGSLMVMRFASRAELDVWLDGEPYVAAGVWQTVHVETCRVVELAEAGETHRAPF